MQPSVAQCPASDRRYFAKMFCDGDWMLVQSRGKCLELFNRTWMDYKYGFGSPDTDLWLGNELMACLTNKYNYTLRFDLYKPDNSTAWSEYQRFLITHEDDNYKLFVYNFTGSGKDLINYTRDPNYSANGNNFSTFDRDNDKSLISCALNMGGGWWYSKCTGTPINTPCEGQPGYNCSRHACMNWYREAWAKKPRYEEPPLNGTTIKMRPTK